MNRTRLLALATLLLPGGTLILGLGLLSVYIARRVRARRFSSVRPTETICLSEPSRRRLEEMLECKQEPNEAMKELMRTRVE